MAQGNSVGTAYLTLVPKLDSNMQELDKGMQDAGKKGGHSFLGSFGSIFKTAAFIGIAHGAASIFMEAFNSYKDYEQLTGGVETLFKGSADTVMKYAENAYATAGVSANQYMETVTGFSASLISSLKGNTAEAAEVANMAMVDMSDNANKMGTSMESVQNAYAGFAKGNFTMLDNLKLGYGGTREEMLRLLEDAEKITGIHYDISNFSDVTKAIHVVQTELDISGYSVDQLNGKLKEMSLTEEELTKVAEAMGISYEEAAQKMADGTLTARDASVLLGTTAREATETIEGSMNMTKAAWANLLTHLGTGEEDIKVYLQNVVDSFIIMAQNIMETAGHILESIGQLIAENLPTLLNDLVNYVVDNAPNMLEAAINLFLQIVTGITKSIPNIIAAIPKLIGSAIDALLSHAVDFVDAGFFLIKGLADGIASAVGWVIDKVKELCSNALDALKSFFGIASPSKVMRQMGGYIGEGLALGIEDSESVVGDAMDGLMSTASIDDGSVSFAAGGSSTINIHSLTVNADDAKSAEAFTAMLRRASMQYA